MLIDRNSKNEFVLNCFRELLDDGEPHRYREIIDYVREQAKGTQYEGTIEQNNLVLPISKKLEDPAFPYARVSHGIYQKTEQSPVQQESVGCHTPSAYDLLDILFVVPVSYTHLFNQEQLVEIYRCCSDTLDAGFDLTAEQEKCIRGVQEQIATAAPDALERIREQEQHPMEPYNQEPIM